MIELSIAVILLGLGTMFYLSQRRETNLSHIQWVISATQLRRDYLEEIKQISEADKLTQLANALSSGFGAVSLKIDIGSIAKQAAERAIMAASGDEHLNTIGVTRGALNYLPTKNAMYWLGRKMSAK